MKIEFKREDMSEYAVYALIVVCFSACQNRDLITPNTSTPLKNCRDGNSRHGTKEIQTFRQEHILPTGMP